MAGLLAAFAAAHNQAMLDVLRPRVLHVARAEPGPRAARARRLVWVLVDGLRLDASRRMPALGRLRADGRDIVGRSAFPTYTLPNLVAQASGIEPRASGVRTDWYPGRVRLDSVFERAKRAGMRTAVVSTDAGGGGVQALYGSWIDETDGLTPGAPLPAAELVFVYVEGPDRAGHAHGAASRAYRWEVRRADRIIERVAQQLDPAHDTLIVTADHGHLDRGGHGGTEPEVVAIPIVLWGAGVPRGSRTTHAASRDVAPTIAAFLGLGSLRHASGRALVPARGGGQHRLAVAAAAAGDRQGPTPATAALAAAVTALLGVGLRGRTRGAGRSAPWVYAATFAALLVVTNTLSFSISNDTSVFSVRLLLLSSIAATVQLLVGGRRSVLPGAFVAAVVVTAGMPLLVADAVPLRTPVRCFLPIPAFAAVSFAGLLAAALGVGVRHGDMAEAPVRVPPASPVPVGLPRSEP